VVWLSELHPFDASLGRGFHKVASRAADSATPEQRLWNPEKFAARYLSAPRSVAAICDKRMSSRVRTGSFVVRLRVLVSLALLYDRSSHGPWLDEAYSHPKASECPDPQCCQDLAANIDFHGAFPLCEQDLFDVMCNHIHHVQVALGVVSIQALYSCDLRAPCMRVTQLVLVFSLLATQILLGT
jgi:hypothetical protein